MLNDAGDVKRLHTVNTQRQWLIGRHVYGAQCIAVELCRINMIDPGNSLLALLYHDAPEVLTGDIPAPTKRHSPAIDKSLRMMEAEFYASWDLLQPGGHLRAHNILATGLIKLELGICKAADTLDLGMSMVIERRNGNRNPKIQHVISNVLDYMIPHYWIPGVKEFTEYLDNEWMQYNR